MPLPAAVDINVSVSEPGDASEMALLGINMILDGKMPPEASGGPSGNESECCEARAHKCATQGGGNLGLLFCYFGSREAYAVTYESCTSL